MISKKIKTTITCFIFGFFVLFFSSQKILAIDAPNPIPVYPGSSIFQNPVPHNDLCFGSDWSAQWYEIDRLTPATSGCDIKQYGWKYVWHAGYMTSDDFVAVRNWYEEKLEALGWQEQDGDRYNVSYCLDEKGDSTDTPTLTTNLNFHFKSVNGEKKAVATVQIDNYDQVCKGQGHTGKTRFTLLVGTDDPGIEFDSKLVPEAEINTPISPAELGKETEINASDNDRIRDTFYKLLNKPLIGNFVRIAIILLLVGFLIPLFLLVRLVKAIFKTIFNMPSASSPLPVPTPTQLHSDLGKKKFLIQIFLIFVGLILIILASIGVYLFLKSSDIVIDNTTNENTVTNQATQTQTKTQTQTPENTVLQDNVLYIGDYKDCKVIFFTNEEERAAPRAIKVSRNNAVRTTLFDCKEGTSSSDKDYLDFKDIKNPREFLRYTDKIEIDDFCSVTFENSDKTYITQTVMHGPETQKLYFSIVTTDLEKTGQERVVYAYFVDDIYQLDLQTLKTKLLISRLLNREADDYSHFVGCAGLTELIDNEYLVLGIKGGYKTEGGQGMGRIIINVDTNEIQSFDDKGVVDFIDFEVDSLNKQISYYKKVFTGQYEECEQEVETGIELACDMYGQKPIYEISELITEDLKI